MAPIPYPEDAQLDAFVVHAALAHEWSVDLLVGYTTADSLEDRVELWRAGPWGLRAPPHQLIDPYGLPVRPITVSETVPWDGEVVDGDRQAYFEARHVGETEEQDYDLVTDALRWDPSVKGGEVKPRRYDVFISYKALDSADFAARLVEKLTDHVEVWFSPERDRVQYVDDITSAINHCDHVVIVWSARSWQGTTQRRAGEPRPDPNEMTQDREIKHIMDMTVEGSSRLIFLCAYDGTSIPADIEDRKWNVLNRRETAQRLHGRNATQATDEELSTALAKLVRSRVNEMKRRTGR